MAGDVLPYPLIGDMPLLTCRHFCRRSGPLDRRDTLRLMDPQAESR